MLLGNASYLWQEWQLRIVLFDDFPAQKLLFVPVEDIPQGLTRLQDTGREVRVVPEPHLGVELVILDLEVGPGRLGAELGRERLPTFLAPWVVVAGAAQLEDER